MPYGGTKKENRNKESKKTLTCDERIPEIIEIYFTKLSPEAKRQKELNHFQSLRKQYSIEDIVYAFRYVSEKGTPGSGAPVHSPMGFLTFSINTVLSSARIESVQIQKRLENDRIENEKKLEKEQEEKKAAYRFSEAISLFNKEFPTRELQDAYLQEFSKRFPYWDENPFGLRNAAISEWASKQKN